ncbi:MAG: hypothetical protein ACI808_002192, partial [Paraglaciecola sp.]
MTYLLKDWLPGKKYRNLHRVNRNGEIQYPIRM